MNHRLERLEFFSLYALYLRENEAFRLAVRQRHEPEELEDRRQRLERIYARLSEQRKRANYPDSAAPGENGDPASWHQTR